MGLKCSVIGHRFEEPGLVHEREPRGDEVISISREVVVCTRCGRQRVLAERKEITNPDPNEKPITNEETTEESNGESDTGSNSDDDEDPNPEINTSSENEEASEPTQSGHERTNPTGFAGVDQISGAGAGFDPAEPDGTVDSTREKPDQVRSAIPRDNGIILTEEGEEREREYGEWPETIPSTETTDEKHVAPANGNSAEATPTEPTSDDAEIIDSSGADGDGAETSAGIVEPIAEDGSMKDHVDNTEIFASSEGSEETESPPAPEMISCPSCQFFVVSSATPFRVGDSCPECHNAYLTEGRN